MATLVRRTWPELRAETIICTGGIDYTGYSTRVEYALDAAAREIALRYHHPELDASGNATVSTNDTTITVPTGAYIVVDVLRANGTALTEKNYHQLLAIASSTAGTPEYFARYGSTLVLNCPVSASVAGTWVVKYYKFPTTPDFAGSGSPDTAWVFDESIIQLAVAKMMGRAWRPDLAGMGLQLLGDWLTNQPQESLSENPLPNLPDLPTASRPFGGSQG